jgi:cobalt-zinc-cadmium efflux system outer membrane protein
MNKLLRTSAFALCCALAVGCASTSPKKSFESASDQVQKQSGHRIMWNQGGDDDKKIGDALAKIVSAEMTPAQAVQVALLNNPTLLATYEDLTFAQADLVQAGLLRNPVFSASITTAERDQLDPNLILGVTQDFLDLLMIPARKKVARGQLEQARLRLVDEVLDLASRTRTAYFMLQGAMQVVAMREVIAQASDAAIELSTRQHEAGNINDLDLANEVASFEQIKLDLGRSQTDLLGAREDFSKLLGIWGPLAANFRIQPTLADLPAEEVGLEHLESVAIAQRADLAAALEQTRTLHYAASLARSTRWTGAINIGADVARLRTGQYVIGPTASIELPIFDQRQAVIARLDAAERAAQQTVRAIAVDIRSDVRRSRARVVAARRFAVRYRDVIIPTRQNVVRLAQTQYDAMLMGVYQLLNARQMEINAYREYIEAVRDYWIARSDLERAVGGGLPVGHSVHSAAASPSLTPQTPAASHSQH